MISRGSLLSDHLTKFDQEIWLYVHGWTAKTHKTEYSKQIFQKRICAAQSQFPHSCVRERFIYFLPILLQENMWNDPGNAVYKSLTAT